MWRRVIKFVATVVILATLLGPATRQVAARWLVIDERALNPVRVCQDGIFLGVAIEGNESNPFESATVTAELVPSGAILFTEVFTLPLNPVPEHPSKTHSDFFFVFWDESFQPLPPGSVVDLNPGGDTDVKPNVADCYITPEEPPVGTAVTYQGRLTDGNSPANGDYDFQFKLYNASQAGSQVGSTVARDNVSVTGGLFTVALDFGSDVFTGGARWLEIGVRPGSSSGAYTLLNPRQALTPAPYAQGLRMGATISGSAPDSALRLSNFTGSGLQVEAGGVGVHVASASDHGVYVASAGFDGFNVFSATVDGVAVNQAGGNGVSVGSAGGTGVYVGSTGFTGVHVGSAGGTGVIVNSAGGDGVSVGSTGGDGVNVWSASDDGVQVDSASDVGVYVRSAGGDGVYAQTISTTGRGVYGYASSTSGTTYGVYGDTRSPNGYGIYGYNSSDGGRAIQGVKEGGSGVAVYGIDLGTTGWGVVGYSQNNIGVWGWTGRVDNYGFYTPDNLYSLNIHLSGAMMYVAQNGSSEALEPGDVVAFSGMGAPLKEGGPPIAQVTRVTLANSPAVAGVVYSRFNIEAVTKAGPAGPASQSDLEVTPAGPVPGGEYLLLVVQGPAQVRVSAFSGSIQPGDLLSTSGDAGYAAKAMAITVGSAYTVMPGTVLGKALEPLKMGQKLIYVFVTLQ